jgi:hypothetical protein
MGQIFSPWYSNLFEFGSAKEAGNTEQLQISLVDIGHQNQ